MNALNEIIEAVCATRQDVCDREKVRAFLLDICDDLPSDPLEARRMLHYAKSRANRLSKIEHWTRGTLSVIWTILELMQQQLLSEAYKPRANI